MPRKPTCECGECMKCYKREWARNRRKSDPEFRVREVEASMRYFRTKKGKAAKARSGKNYRKNNAIVIAANKRDRYHSLSDKECVWCSTSVNLTLDHMHPQIKGGTSEPNNLQTLYRSCNSFKQARLVTAGDHPGIMIDN